MATPISSPGGGDYGTPGSGVIFEGLHGVRLRKDHGAGIFGPVGPGLHPSQYAFGDLPKHGMSKFHVPKASRSYGIRKPRPGGIGIGLDR